MQVCVREVKVYEERGEHISPNKTFNADYRWGIDNSHWAVFEFKASHLERACESNVAFIGTLVANPADSSFRNLLDSRFLGKRTTNRDARGTGRKEKLGILAIDIG